MGHETDKDLSKAKHELGEDELDKVSGGVREDAKHLDPNARIDEKHQHEDISRIK
ncbi:MAG: hypothetical protein JO092_09835 [Candidatus Eremiobacteraeota bacterium]|nr:hypothetical protein [Candidatus Eremiobacteraeota bacterium]MBV8374738.1 hypothetical protein [Candidatus Eremiobacteraeota bacterium]